MFVRPPTPSPSPPSAQPPPPPPGLPKPLASSKPMSLISATLSRLSSTTLYITRLAIHRFGLGSVLLAVTAAAALFISWRASRHPPPPPRRRRRPRSSTNTPPSTTEAPDPSPSSDFPAPASTKPSWLNRVRRVTLGAKWSPSASCDLFCHASEAKLASSSTANSVVVRPHQVDALKKFAAKYDFYVIVQVDDDTGEQAVVDAMCAAGLFDQGLMDPRKLIFCETEFGRASIARQIESHLHVDESVAVITDLQRFLPYVSLVSANAMSFSCGRKVTKFTALSSFFS